MWFIYCIAYCQALDHLPVGDAETDSRVLEGPLPFHFDIDCSRVGKVLLRDARRLVQEHTEQQEEGRDLEAPPQDLAARRQFRPNSRTPLHLSQDLVSNRISSRKASEETTSSREN